MTANIYSEEWFSHFLSQVPARQTAHEVAFLTRQLPAHANVLDLCCGNGRHSVPLAAAGFDITGLDKNEEAIRLALRQNSKANFILGDLRNHHLPDQSFHAILLLWQSYGYFTPMENRRLFGVWHKALKNDGRLILDVYNRDFFQGKDGVRATGNTTESKQLKGRRLLVHLQYANGKADAFDWELFTLPELRQIGEEAGFELLLACSGFDEAKPVNENEPRMQLVFRKI